VKGVTLFKEPKNCRSNYWLQTLILDKDKSNNLNPILESTNSVGIMTRPAWALISELIPYKDFPKMDLVNANSLSGRIVNIPSSPAIVLGHHG